MALARACGVSKPTIYRWIKRGCPRNADGSFDPVAVAEWAQQMRHEAKVQGASGAPRDAAAGEAATAPVVDLGEGRRQFIDRERAEAEWRQHRADLSKLELEERRGELVPRADIAELLRHRALLFRKLFDAMRRRLGPRMVGLTDPREADLILAEEHNALLAEVYGDGGPASADPR